ncbi:MAG TPA: hypothetical protein VFF73_03060 [Planctomycetota bacterium]|nr:hypothetical protein [Planctomycetota bacterium]
MLRTDRVTRALGFFGTEERGIQLPGTDRTVLRADFLGLSSRLGIANSVGHPTRPLTAALACANQDLYNAVTICSRLEWQSQQASEEKLDRWLWATYSQLDIEHSLVQMRSLHDHLAHLIQRASGDERPTVALDSFHAIRTNSTKRGKLNLGLAVLVERDNTKWFAGLRELRDNAVHHGRDTLVFGRPQDGILFGLQDEASMKVIRAVPELGLWAPGREGRMIVNPSVLDFRRYAATVLSEVLCFMDDVARVIHDLYRDRAPHYVEGGATLWHHGLPVLRSWMQGLLKHAERFRAERGQAGQSR